MSQKALLRLQTPGVARAHRKVPLSPGGEVGMTSL